MCLAFRQKRGFFIWLSLVLFLQLLHISYVLAEDKSFFYSQEGPQALSYASHDNTMYIMTNEGLFSMTVNSEAVTVLMDEAELLAHEISIDSLLYYSDNLMIFDPTHKRIWEFNPGSVLCVMDFNSTILDKASIVYSNLTYQNDFLFVRAIEEGAFEYQSRIFKIDINSGKIEALSVQGIMQLMAYHENELLALKFLDTASDTPYEVVSIDVNSGLIKKQVATLHHIGDGGLAYSRQSDKIFAIVNGELCKLNENQWLPIRHITFPKSPYAYDVLSNYYIVASNYGLVLAEVGSTVDNVTLRIQGRMPMEDIDHSFTLSHSDITISRSTELHFCAEEVYKAILSGDTTDLYYIPLTTGVKFLIQKGFLYPLNSSATLMTDCNKILIQIAEPLQHDDEVFALPVDIFIYGWMMKNDIDNNLNAPETIAELLVQQLIWQDDLNYDGTPWVAQAYDGALPWNLSDYLRYLLSQYIMLHDDATSPLSFSNDQFRSVLTSIKDAKNKLSLTNNALSLWNNASQSVLCSDSILSLNSISYTDAHIIQPPKIFNSELLAIPARLMVYVLNPLSQNKEAAFTFLEYVSSHRNASTQAMMSPETANAILFPHVQQTLDDVATELARLKTVVDTFDNEQRTAALERMDQLKLEKDALLGLNSWAVFGPALTEYKMKIAPYVNLQQSIFLDDMNGFHSVIFEGMLKILNQYVEDSISLDICIQKLESIASVEFYERDVNQYQPR